MRVGRHIAYRESKRLYSRYGSSVLSVTTNVVRIIWDGVWFRISGGNRERAGSRKRVREISLNRANDVSTLLIALAVVDRRVFQ